MTANFNTVDVESYYDSTYSLKKLTMEEYINHDFFETIMIGLRDVSGAHHMLDGAANNDKQMREGLLDLGVDKYALLAHNMHFDGAILAWKYGIVPPLYMDTMAMARPLLYPKYATSSLHDLGELFQGLIGTKGTEVHDAQGKTRKMMTPEFYEAYSGYCANDVQMTALLFLLLKKQLPPEEFIMIDRTIRMYTVPRMRMDRKHIKLGLLEEQGRKTEVVSVLAGMGYNKDDMMSNARFARCIQDQGGTVPFKTSKTTGRQSPAFAKTDEGFIKLVNSENTRVSILAKSRLILKSTLGESRMQRLLDICDRMDHQLPVPLRYYGTLTARFAGMEKINMQNPPQSGPIRTGMLPAPGYMLVAADQAQIEARMNAVSSNEGALVESFRLGEDVYSELASDIFGFTVTKDTHPKERFVGKVAILGLGYGMGHKRFREMLKGSSLYDGNTSEEFCQRVVNTYRAKYASIVANWKTANQMIELMIAGTTAQWGAVTTGKNKIILPNGMELYYKNLLKSGTGYDAEYFYDSPMGRGRFQQTRLYGPKLVENVMQALTRVLLSHQLVHLSHSFHVVMQMHDEIVFMVEAPAVKTAVAKICNHMEIPPPWMPNIPLEVEAKVGFNYAECK